MVRDQAANPFGDGPDQIINVINDVFIPKYSVFGRHHFIMKKELSALVIVSIGESSSEKQRLLEDLANSTSSWYNYFIEQQVIPAGSLEFTYRDFLNHGCYPFAINELFNGEVNERLGNRQLSTQILLRSPLSSTSSKSIFNLSEFIYSPNENNPYPNYIYLKGFLVDFIRFVTLPIQLAESEQLRTQKPIMTQEQSDGRAILCHRSTESNKFFKGHSTFFMRVTTFFSSCDLQVPVFVDTSNPHFRTAETLDPISTVLRAYHELVLDACSVDQCNDTPLARCFSTFFDAFKLIDNDQYDEILATYLTEIQSCNYFDDTEKYLENLEIPQSVGEVYEYFKNELISFKKTFTDLRHGSDEKRKTATYLYQSLCNTIIFHFYESKLEKFPVELDINAPSWIFSPFENKIDFESFIIPDMSHELLIPLDLEFSRLRKYLQELHKNGIILFSSNQIKSFDGCFQKLFMVQTIT
ncbi:unnamed protein product [Rotaria socialis]|uniref:Uncharacterized protein n=1 Tax=Rotaria socialis TaxID=392032 RepID=A0A818FNA8_9BILA|nr:unnamed protein product [Rotaria socialis]CAF4475348.1 unnamed protein product [Rotaria socialis]